MKFIAAILLFISSQVNGQRITIDSFTFKVVSIDPNSKRVFISYDSLFNNAPRVEEAFLKHINEIEERLAKHVSCLFSLKYISFFANSIYAKYMPLDKNEYSEWMNDYLGEYDIQKKEIITFPAIKNRSKKIKIP